MVGVQCLARADLARATSTAVSSVVTMPNSTIAATTVWIVRSHCDQRSNN
jgi:hypothetical protein